MADHPAADRVGEVAVGPPEQRLDPAQQLAQPERLGQVVVRAELQADDLVDLLVAGGEHQHRRLRAGRAQPAQDLEAVHARQPDVEQDRGPAPISGRDLEALLAGAGEGDLVALLLQGVLDPARDGVLVFDDQDRGGHWTARWLHRGAPAVPAVSAARARAGLGLGVVPYAPSTYFRRPCFRMSAAPPDPSSPPRAATITGKKVAYLRRDGRLPAVVFGRGLDVEQRLASTPTSSSCCAGTPARTR